MQIENEHHSRVKYENGQPTDKILGDGDPSIEWTNVSCGVSTAYVLPNSGEEFVKSVLTPRPVGWRRSGRTGVACEAFIMFSDRTSNNGPRIARYIADRPWLGSIVESAKAINPNTGSTIQVWIWAPNYADDDVKVALFGKVGSTLLNREGVHPLEAKGK